MRKIAQLMQKQCSLWLVHADFKNDLKVGSETEKIEVIRWQFPLLYGVLRTAYSAQGVLVAWMMLTGG